MEGALPKGKRRNANRKRKMKLTVMSLSFSLSPQGKWTAEIWTGSVHSSRVMEGRAERKGTEEKHRRAKVFVALLSFCIFKYLSYFLPLVVLPLSFHAPSLSPCSLPLAAAAPSLFFLLPFSLFLPRCVLSLFFSSSLLVSSLFAPHSRFFGRGNVA